MEKLEYNDLMERTEDTFCVIGDSMMTDGSDSIPPESIISAKYIHKSDWHVEYWGLPRFRRVPYWVIYCTEFRRPLLKKVIEYNYEEGYIVCRSLNNKYTDFKLNLEDIRALYFVTSFTKTLILNFDEPIVVDEDVINGANL